MIVRSRVSSLALVGALLILALQLLFISFTLDAYTLLKNDAIEGWHRGFAYFGQIAKMAVVGLFIFLVVFHRQVLPAWRHVVSEFSLRRFALFMLFELSSYFGLLLVSVFIYSPPEELASPGSIVFIAWLVLAALTLALWFCATVKPSTLWRFLQGNYLALVLIALGSVLLWAISVYSQQAWGPLAEYTFRVTTLLLSFYDPDLLYVNAASKEVGLGSFIVHIAPACSGYEGIALINAFIALYLYLSRDQLRFPHALILFPLGTLVIWLLNSVRIAALVAIGYHWSAGVAVGGFHSQAGWITFILTSLGLLYLVDRSRFFNKRAETNASAQPVNLAIATLIPLVALLLTTLISAALTSQFDYWYPIRVLVVAIAVIRVWSYLDLAPYTPRWESAAAAVAVAVLWIVLLGSNADGNTLFQQGLDDMPRWAAIAWLAIRFAGAAITVPIAEELAFRGYLLCKVSRQEVITRGALPVVLPAILISSLAFGMLHGAWIAGTVAGLIYAWVRLRTAHIGDAILAHGVTNALLFVYAMWSGEWSVL